MKSFNVYTQYETRTMRTFCRMRPEFDVSDSQPLDAPSCFPQGSHLALTETHITSTADTSREMCAAWGEVFSF